jgi:hypothetical protein
MKYAQSRGLTCIREIARSKVGKAAIRQWRVRVESRLPAQLRPVSTLMASA